MRRMLRLSSVRVVLLAVTFAMVLAASASAAPTVTIGQATPAANAPCGGPFWGLQLGSSSDVVPAGLWDVTSWTTYAYLGSVSFMVLQPGTVSGTYDVVAESPVETLPSTQVESTFTVDIPVQAGDLIGWWQKSSNMDGCYTRPGSGSIAPQSGGPVPTEPAVGSVLTPGGIDPDARWDLSATLTPANGAALCAATTAFVHGSAAYTGGSAAWKEYANLLVADACGDMIGIEGFPGSWQAVKINIYEAYTQVFAADGFLTSTQEALLNSAASAL
jgi:hypothetical protein